MTSALLFFGSDNLHARMHPSHSNSRQEEPLIASHSRPNSNSSSQRKCRPDISKLAISSAFVVCIILFAGLIWYMFLRSGGVDPFAHIQLPSNCTCVEERAQKSCLEKDIFHHPVCVPREEVCSDGLHVPEWLCPQDCSTPCKYDLKVCQRNMCSNGGVCQAIDNDRKCMCSYGYSGSDCKSQIDPNVCGDTLSRPAENVMTVTAESSCHCASLCDFVSDCHRWEFIPPTQCDLRKSSTDPSIAATATGQKSGVKSCGGLSANHTGEVLSESVSDDACGCKELCYEDISCFGWSWSSGSCYLRNKGSLTLEGWENGLFSGHRDINCHPIINFKKVTDGVENFPLTDAKEVMGQECAQMCALEKPQFECHSLQNNTYECNNMDGDQHVSYQYVEAPTGEVSQFCCGCHESFRCHFLECSEESPGACLTCRASQGFIPSLLLTFCLLIFLIF